MLKKKLFTRNKKIEMKLFIEKNQQIKVIQIKVSIIDIEMVIK